VLKFQRCPIIVTCIDPLLLHGAGGICKDGMQRGSSGGHGNLGDYWTYCSCLLRLSEDNPHYLIKVKGLHRTIEHLNMLRPYFDSKGHFFTDDIKINYTHQSEERLITWKDMYTHDLVPTIKTWKNKTRNICYQFDGHSESHLKNPSHQEEQFFIHECKKAGYNPVDVGHFTPIRTIIELLSEAKFFVGVPSGIASIAMHVGVPMAVITNRYSDEVCAHLQFERYSARPDALFLKNNQEYIKYLLWNESASMMARQIIFL